MSFVFCCSLFAPLPSFFALAFFFVRCSFSFVPCPLSLLFCPLSLIFLFFILCPLSSVPHSLLFVLRLYLFGFIDTPPSCTHTHALGHTTPHGKENTKANKEQGGLFERVARFAEAGGERLRLGEERVGRTDGLQLSVCGVGSLFGYQAAGQRHGQRTVGGVREGEYSARAAGGWGHTTCSVRQRPWACRSARSR